MRSIWLLALATSGCRAVLGIGDPPELFGSCATWHPDGFDPCALEITVPALALGDEVYVYDTAASAGGTLYDSFHRAIVQSDQTIARPDGQPDESPIAVLSVGRFTTSAGTRLSVIGPRPLLIVSWSSIVIDGVIDASSHLGFKSPENMAAHIAETIQFGAGANQDCLASAGHGGNDAYPTGGSGGGGGGGFRAMGGRGGPGGGQSAVPGGAGGQPAAAIGFYGGCPGGASGAAGTIAMPPATAGSRALGGSGGGALRLVAYNSIEVLGAISANGAGGAGAPTNTACGGGGGGSGGYIGFEAPIVTLRGLITANGGGGGGGSSATGTGKDGMDGAVSEQPAPGGDRSASGCGEPGGAGGAAATLGGADAGDATKCSGGGGGGGGASGFIVVRSLGYTADAATLSPAAQLQ